MKEQDTDDLLFLAESDEKTEGNRFGGDDIDEVILNGITFRGGPKKETPQRDGKVRSKAKKKQYVTGSHGSGAAKKKADIRRKRANRHK